MNIVERRRIVKGNIIDVSVAKAAVNASRRQQREAAKKLRKAMAASHFASMQNETIAYPRQLSR